MEHGLWDDRIMTRMMFYRFIASDKSKVRKTRGIRFTTTPSPVKGAVKRPSPNKICPFCSSTKKFKKCCEKKG